MTLHDRLPYPRIYFRTPYGRQRRWAFGTRPATVDLNGRQTRRMRNDEPALYAFGAYEQTAVSRAQGNEWGAWPRRCVWRPACEIVNRPQENTDWLIRPPGPAADGRPASIEQLVDRLRRLGSRSGPQPDKSNDRDEGGVRAVHRPAFDEWRVVCEAALDAIHRDALAKVVLCRRTHVRLNAPCNPWTVIDRLDRSHPDGYVFMIQWNEHAALVGVSPERLYERRERTIITEAVAGTRTPQAPSFANFDAAPTPKEQREHEWVVHMIEQTLQRLCRESKRLNPPVLTSHGATHHFRTVLQGLLHDDISDAAILRALHPTPAVCGWPTEAARHFIRSYEPFDRGCYTGWFGYQDGEEALFSVNLRCGLFQGNEVFLYAGAGLVLDSDPRLEWTEMEEKIRFWWPILVALNNPLSRF